LNTRIDNLKDKINNVPELPGIYKMLDSKGKIIYIGKSKSLKKRVKSYFISTPKWEKIKKLVS
jgi:excinuclease ABC subunit C